MIASQRAAAAGLCALAALLADWTCAELYLRDDSALNVVGALGMNALLVAAGYAALRHWAGERASVVTLRALAVVIAGLVVLSSLRSAFGAATLTGPSRLALTVALVGGALLLAWRAGDALGDGLMRAVALGSIAFVVTPPLWHLAVGKPITWIDAAPASQEAAPAGTLFLLLDELGADATGPITATLRSAGMNVDEQALPSAAANTTNAIPSMFAPIPFRHARPCGRSTICDGTNFVDFSRIHVRRPDVHVTGLLHPYCDIEGLRSCQMLQQHHEHGNAYRSLLAFYLRRLSPKLAESLRSPLPAGLVRAYLQRQRAFVDASEFWRDGGVLYAHLFLPHPPGLDGATTLDADYAGNIDAATALVGELAARARSAFGGRFSILITSDHALRDTWCLSPLYHARACTLRPAFGSDLVPLIVATPRPLLGRRIATNAQVFSVLAAELQRAP
jgi:hypothetical protein